MVAPMLHWISTHCILRSIKQVINHGDLSIVTSGDLWAREEYWQSKFDLRLDQISADQIKLFWPQTYIPKTRRWVSSNLQQGLVSDLTGFINQQDGKTQFDFKFAFDDVTTGLVATIATKCLTGRAKEI